MHAGGWNIRTMVKLERLWHIKSLIKKGVHVKPLTTVTIHHSILVLQVISPFLKEAQVTRLQRYPSENISYYSKMFWLVNLGLTLQFVLLTFSDRNVFGVPLSVVLQRTGQPLPRSILFAINYLQRTGNQIHSHCFELLKRNADIWKELLKNWSSCENNTFHWIVFLNTGLCFSFIYPKIFSYL